MKKKWETPQIAFQKFAANEYITACYSLYCKVSGDGSNYIKDTWHDLNRNHWAKAVMIQLPGMG